MYVIQWGRLEGSQSDLCLKVEVLLSPGAAFELTYMTYMSCGGTSCEIRLLRTRNEFKQQIQYEFSYMFHPGTEPDWLLCELRFQVGFRQDG